MKRLLLFNTLLIGLLLLLAQLGRYNKTGDNTDNAWAPPSHLPEPPAGIDMNTTLNLMIWRDYMPDEVLEAFTRRYGTRIHVVNYENNEELLTLYQEDPLFFDVMMPSDYMVSHMIRNNYLAPLHQENIPMMKHLREDVLRVKFDPGLRYCIPFYQEAVGIAFNVNYISGFPREWNYLFLQKNNPYLVYRISTLKEMRMSIGFALIILGYSPNSRNPDEIRQARDFIVKQRREIGLQLEADDLVNKMVNNDILLSLCWNGTCSKILFSEPDIRFMLPEETTITSLDCFVINTDSKKKTLAEFFINYLLIPQVSGRMTNFSNYANTNSSSLTYVDRYIRNGPSYLFPEEEKAISLEDIGEAFPYYLEAWNAIQDATAAESVVELPLPQEGFYSGIQSEMNKTRNVRHSYSVRNASGTDHY